MEPRKLKKKKKRLNGAKNISSLLRQKIIKTFASREKVTEHKLLKIQFPLLLEGNAVRGAKQLKYKQTNKLLLTKYGAGFRV